MKKGNIPVFLGVSLSRNELDECIETHGSLKEVERAIYQIQHSIGRPRHASWFERIVNWKIKKLVLHPTDQHVNFANRLLVTHSESLDRNCKMYLDTRQKKNGLTMIRDGVKDGEFYEEIFLPFDLVDFKHKALLNLRQKKIQKSKILRPKKNKCYYN